MQANDDIERNITSSDVEFLEGNDSKENSNTTSKTMRKVKDKTESAHAPFDNALTTPDLPGTLATHDDVDIMMDDIYVSVHDQIIDKELT